MPNRMRGLFFAWGERAEDTGRYYGPDLIQDEVHGRSKGGVFDEVAS